MVKVDTSQRSIFISRLAKHTTIMPAKRKKAVRSRAVTKKGIAVIVSRFGADPVPVAVPRGTTIEDVLEKAGIDVGGREEVFIDGESRDLDDKVTDGDILSIVTPKAAGAK